MVKEAALNNLWSKREADVLSILGSSENGLTEQEARSRLEKYGQNELKKKRFVPLIIFLRQFKSPLIWILVAVSLISAFFGQLTDTIIILSIVLIASLLSFYNEFRSERIVEDLNRKIAHKATVIRNGEKIEVDARHIVPGDIVYLAIGSIVPADIRIIQAKNLEINEAVLTGESMPVKKHSAALRLNNFALRDIKNCAFSGTVVVEGECLGVVIKTGESTEFGKLAKEAVQEKPETEFQKGIDKFGGMLLKTILVLVIAIFFINTLMKHEVLNSLMFALAIAIGLTPELLPMIITVGLSRGAHAMAKHDVIVKRLISIEDFGNMDVLCTDKTGTLTEGTITLYSHLDANDKSNENVMLYSLLCNSAVVHGKKNFGNPIDIALWQHAKADIKEKSKHYAKIDEVPFDYERKRMSVVVKKDKKVIFITKGAPYSVLKNCSKIYLNGRAVSMASHLKKMNKKFSALAEKGFRVIAVACKEVTPKKDYEIKDETGLTFIGYVTFLDPPKKTSKNAIERLAAMNIKLKILTGDNEQVTQRVTEEIGLPMRNLVLGHEIDKMDDEKLKVAVENANLFCRLTPFHKQRIIKALKQNGHDVGFMGDGVNDVPALHEADVAISVNDAVDVAKEASDIILLRKSLNALAEGVIQGRKIFSNTIKYIFTGTSSNFGNMFSAAAASIFLPFLPMLPVQILLTNLIYDFSEMTIPTDNVDEEYVKKPKKFNISMIKKYMLFFGPISSIYDILTYLVMIFVFNATASLFQTGWFIESLITQALVVLIIRTRRIPFFKSRPSNGLLASIVLVVLLAILLPFTVLGKVFGFTQPPMLYFIILIAMVITYLVLVEVGKYFFFKKYEI